MREGWLIDASDHWVWRSIGTTPPGSGPQGLHGRGRQLPEGPPLLKERRYLRKDAVEDVELPSDPGVEEDKTYGVRLPNLEKVLSGLCPCDTKFGVC